MIKEVFRRWQERTLFCKIQNSGEKVDPSQMGQRAIEMTRGAKDIKMVVTPRPGNPLFEALPSILEAAGPDSKVEIILAIPKNFTPTEEVRETLEKTMEIAGKKNGPKMDAIADNDPDLEKLDLELRGEPNLDKLVVFIKDPKNPQQYWHRRIGIEKGVMKLGDSEKELPYVDVKVFSMEVPDSVPVPAHLLEFGLEKILETELWLSTHHDKDMRDAQAVVGVAKYTGTNDLSLGKIVNLTAIKYSKRFQPKQK